MLNLLEKFDNIEVKQIDKITAEDREYCEIKEKLYILAHNVYSDTLQKLKSVDEIQKKEFDKIKEKYNMQDYSRNYFGYVSDYGDCGTHEIETTIVKITGSFISKITYYFKNKYMVELDSEYKSYDGFNHYHDSPDKLNIITLDDVLENYIFSKLDGFTFTELAIQQIKEKAKTPLYWYSYQKYWNYEIKGKTIKFRSNIDNIYPALYYYDSNETKIIDYYSFQKVNDTKHYENGNTDIKFYNAEFALEFATKYLGYIEMTEEEREEYKKKSRY